jgi:hypothetical protein
MMGEIPMRPVSHVQEAQCLSSLLCAVAGDSRSCMVAGDLRGRMVAGDSRGCMVVGDSCDSYTASSRPAGVLGKNIIHRAAYLICE